MNPTGSERSPAHRAPMLAAVLVTAGVDIAVFRVLYGRPESLAFAHGTGFLAAAATGSLLLAAARSGIAFRLRDLPSVLVIALLVLFLRGGVLASLAQLGFTVPTAQFVSALLAAALFCLAFPYSLHSRRMRTPAELRWRHYVVGIVVYSILLRLAWLGVPELIFEEAYYWNYARHPDIGYLDHPLMVAWTIKPFIALMGDNEFAVRIGALLFWFVTAWCSYRLTREAFGKTAAEGAVLLIAILPVYFSFGWFISPDAPLTAFWAMAVYCSWRIVIRDDGKAWLGLGAAVGLGLSSKYTIALLGAAIVLYVLADRRSRKWLSRPQPYAAAVIALLLASPVVLWNMQNDWASLAFQTEGRLAAKSVFSLPRFIGNVLVFLTPTGVLAVIAVVLERERLLSGLEQGDRQAGDTLRRTCRLLTWLALFPLAVFATLSLFKTSKLNWTGPVWLALIPLLALLITRRPEAGEGRLLEWSRRAWPNTAILCLLVYGAFFHHLGPGLPGVAYPQNLHLIGWRDFGRELDDIVARLERETGKEILVVGMDRNRIASGLAFYRTRRPASPDQPASRDPAFSTASEHLFGAVGLMYELWFPAARQEGRTMLLVAANAARLDSDAVRGRVRELGDIHALSVVKNGRLAGRYHYRLVSGYHDEPGRQDRAAPVRAE
ncbi:MAG TPA: hypothetical protein DHV08_14750 [Rhodocyclaceae bacterium]|nr:hypothetical protein [Rhodocyclaceae bacterium]